MFYTILTISFLFAARYSFFRLLGGLLRQIRIEGEGEIFFGFNLRSSAKSADLFLKNPAKIVKSNAI